MDPHACRYRVCATSDTIFSAPLRVRLQQLCRDRDRNRRGLLARNSWRADRARHRCEPRARHATTFQPFLELLSLCA
jgi:hypothetical protein